LISAQVDWFCAGVLPFDAEETAELSYPEILITEYKKSLFLKLKKVICRNIL